MKVNRVLYFNFGVNLVKIIYREKQRLALLVLAR
jgi:hypothetical protein